MVYYSCQIEDEDDDDDEDDLRKLLSRNVNFVIPSLIDSQSIDPVREEQLTFIHHIIAVLSRAALIMLYLTAQNQYGEYIVNSFVVTHHLASWTGRRIVKQIDSINH